MFPLVATTVVGTQAVDPILSTLTVFFVALALTQEFLRHTVDLYNLTRWCPSSLAKLVYNPLN